MDDLVLTKHKEELAAALYRGESALPLPFERDVFLIGIEIAGTNHSPNIVALFEALQEGDRVQLFREPENEYDEYAVRIDAQPVAVSEEEKTEVSASVKLGYIPRQYNKIPARLMDAGKYLYGVVRKKEETGGYYHIVVKIYMQD